jgi:hypothetical protein
MVYLSLMIAQGCSSQKKWANERSLFEGNKSRPRIGGQSGRGSLHTVFSVNFIVI